MQVKPWTLQDVVLFRSEAFEDERGFFVRTMSATTLAEAGLDHRAFVEESQSRSRHKVLRGLHGRAALSEGKLVRCARGEIFEVVVDLRPTSSTFLQWDSLVLDDRSNLQLWVPPGFVHGFQVVSDEADVCYQMDAVHDPALDIAVAWNDPDLGIEWPIADPILSERDRTASSLAELRPRLDEWFTPSP
jgi:dTDP-4-dehydrorhamnose 3,5-epimerase